MQVKQYNIKIFEIAVEKEEEFLEFIEKNGELLKRYLLFLRGKVTPRARKALKKRGIAWTTSLPVEHAGNARSGTAVAKQSGLTIFDQIVRSGQEVTETKDLLLLKRINSGAKVTTDGNVISLNRIEGTIECNGEFMLVKPTAKARIVFNGVDITEAMDEECFYKIRFKENEILISKYAKDIEWV
ncbi:septum site-determining protein MinC [Hydrogenimonas sp.]